jgi:hypothetical protein
MRENVLAMRSTLPPWESVQAPAISAAMSEQPTRALEARAISARPTPRFQTSGSTASVYSSEPLIITKPTIVPLASATVVRGAVGAIERVPDCAILGAQAVEVCSGQDATIPDLPGAHVHARDHKRVGRSCEA